MREQILELLAKDNKLNICDLSLQLNVSQDAVAAEIKAMQEDGVICGQTTLINWEKTNRDYLTALIEVKVTPQRGSGYDKIAERMYRIPEVKSVYLMSSGGFDFLIIIEGKNMKEIGNFVSEKLSSIDAVISTATHFVLKNYKDSGVILTDKHNAFCDERMIISP